MNDDNPFAKLGLQKEVVESMHRQGRLGDFLRTYHRSIQVHIHPDRGGDSALAAAINAAYTEIQRKPASVPSWIQKMSNGNGINPEYLELIEGLTAKVEELQGIEKDYRKLQEQHAALLTSRSGDGTKADVHKASPKARREEIFWEDFDESAGFEDAPAVKKPKAKRVDADAAPRTAARKEAAPKSEPLVLPEVILYDAKGKPARRYAKVTLYDLVTNAVGNPVSKTQDGWISHYKTAGEELLSLPLLYAIIERIHTEKNPAGAGLLRSLQKHWIVTSTRIDYKKDRVTHGYGFASAETYACPIPGGNHWVDEIEKDTKWRSALQALLMPKDVNHAVTVLHEFSGVRPHIWMASNRKSNPIRAAFVYANPDWFSLNCNVSLGDTGCSRRVALE